MRVALVATLNCCCFFGLSCSNDAGEIADSNSCERYGREEPGNHFHKKCLEGAAQAQKDIAAHEPRIFAGVGQTLGNTGCRSEYRARFLEKEAGPRLGLRVERFGNGGCTPDVNAEVFRDGYFQVLAAHFEQLGKSDALTMLLHDADEHVKDISSKESACIGDEAEREREAAIAELEERRRARASADSRAARSLSRRRMERKEDPLAGL